jgi:hypothetical protein
MPQESGRRTTPTLPHLLGAVQPLRPPGLLHARMPAEGLPRPQHNQRPPDAHPHPTPRRSRRDVSVYQCPDCDQPYLGQQWCPDCQRPCLRLGYGGNCPHCAEPVSIDQLLAAAP